jgi:hypothetical protein
MKRPIRICFVIDGLTRAGTETQLLALIRMEYLEMPDLKLTLGERPLS